MQPFFFHLRQVLVYFARGRLPWQGIKCAVKKQRYERICAVKTATSIQELCHGLPAAYRRYFQHVRSLEFEDRPDYDLLRSYFSEALAALGEDDGDARFDWELAAAAETELQAWRRRR